MSFILLLAAFAAPPPDCDTVQGPIAVNECRLAQSIEQLPDVDCDDQQTQLDMNVCSYRDHLRADTELNRMWARAAERAKQGDRWMAERGHSGGEFERLLAAQRRWIDFRDAQCALEAGPREGGGSIWPLLMNNCLATLTRTRTAQLREYMEPGR